MGGRGGGRGRGLQQDRRVQQRKKKVQRGLEDNVRRTVYVSYINHMVRSPSIALADLVLPPAAPRPSLSCNCIVRTMDF